MPVRHLNLLEFQSKDLLQKYGVAIQQFKVLDNSKADAEVVKTFGKAEEKHFRGLCNLTQLIDV